MPFLNGGKIIFMRLRCVEQLNEILLKHWIMKSSRHYFATSSKINQNVTYRESLQSEYNVREIFSCSFSIGFGSLELVDYIYCIWINGR